MIEVIEYLTLIYPWILLGVAVAAAIWAIGCSVAARLKFVRTVRRGIEEKWCAVCRHLGDVGNPGCRNCARGIDQSYFEVKAEYRKYQKKKTGRRRRVK